METIKTKDYISLFTYCSSTHFSKISLSWGVIGIDQMLDINQVLVITRYIYLFVGLLVGWISCKLTSIFAVIIHYANVKCSPSNLMGVNKFVDCLYDDWLNSVWIIFSIVHYHVRKLCHAVKHHSHTAFKLLCYA